MIADVGSVTSLDSACGVSVEYVYITLGEEAPKSHDIPGPLTDSMCETVLESYSDTDEDIPNCSTS